LSENCTCGEPVINNRVGHVGRALGRVDGKAELFKRSGILHLDDGVGELRAAVLLCAAACKRQGGRQQKSKYYDKCPVFLFFMHFPPFLRLTALARKTHDGRRWFHA
jgi:hypothetical protein